MTYGYAFKDYDKDSMARTVLLSASVSTKHCIEICNRLKGKKVAKAKEILGGVIELKTPIAFTKFNDNIGHKAGIGPGRFPQKAATEVLKALNSCEANAANKGLNTDMLKIRHMSANLASRPWHYGRARRRKSKRTHVEIVLEEMENGPKKDTVTKN